MVQAVRLKVVENITKGYFDPITLASEIRIALDKGVDAKQSAKERHEKAISLRVGRARAKVLKAYVDANPGVSEKHLKVRSSRNHPMCMHACLIGEMVKALYPHKDVYVCSDDVRWLMLRAPKIPISRADVSSEGHTKPAEGCHVVAEDTIHEGNPLLATSHSSGDSEDYEAKMNAEENDTTFDDDNAIAAVTDTREHENPLAQVSTTSTNDVVSRDIIPPASHVDNVVRLVAKGGDQSLGVETACDEVDEDDEDTTPKKTASTPQPVEVFSPEVDRVKITYQQVMDAIRRVPCGHECEGYGSVYDVIVLVTGCHQFHATQHLHRMMEVHPQGVDFQTIFNYKFPGQGQRLTPVAPLKVLVEIIMLLPGCGAREFRKHCCQILCRVFAGDPNLHIDIEANRASLSEQDRRDLVRDIPQAADIARSAQTAQTAAVTHFCGRTCAKDLDLTQLVPVPGLSSDLPSLDVMRRHGNYLFVLGMVEVCGVNMIVPKPGASFHGVDGMHGRYMSALRDHKHLSVMFMEPSTATVARDGESAMKHSLSSLGNAFQVGDTEKWVVTVPAGMQPSDAARTLANRLQGSLPTPRLEPAAGTVSEEVARAFRCATISADGACSVKGGMWADNTGHQYNIEIVRAENELEKHKVDKQAEIEIEIEKHRTEARLASLQKSLADGLITQEQYLQAL